MKTTLLDFVLSALCFGLLLAASGASLALLSTALTRPLLAAYHPVADFFLFLLLYGLLSALLLAALRRIAPLQAGSFPLDDRNFTRWKLYAMIFYTARAALLPLTHIAARPLVLKLFGARIGTDVAIGGDVDTPYLTAIGDGTAIGNGSHVVGTMTVNDRFVVGRVTIGRNVTVAMNAVVMPDVEIGDNAVVETGAVVMPGSRIPAGERWRGNPARKWMGS